MMIILVLPAYNEAESIQPLLQRVKKFEQEHQLNIQVVVVDDGSSDDTAAVVRGFSDQIIVLEHKQNQGLSVAINTGLLHAIQIADQDDLIVTMDSDDTHMPALMNRMLARIEEGYDVVIASRYLHDSRIIGLSRWRQFLSYGASWLFRVAFPIRGVRDYTCGYRAYRASIIKAAFERWKEDFISESGFSVMVDILLKLRTMDVIFVEVPLILRYDRKQGASKMNVRKTIRQTLSLLVRRRIRGVNP